MHAQFKPFALLALHALLALLIVGLMGPASVAWAHPLDEYLQATYISIEPQHVAIELNLTPGLLVAPQVVPQIDTDGDGELSEAEGTAYAQAVLRDIVVIVDGRTLSPTLTASQFPPLLNLNSGIGTIRIDASVEVGNIAAGQHALIIQNQHQPVKSTYQMATLVPKSSDIKIAQQQHDEAQHGIQIDYTMGSALAASNAAAVTSATSANSQQQQLIDALSIPTLTPPLVALAFGLAIVLGGLHALTPGHGKTLVAAYLVGSRGPRDTPCCWAASRRLHIPSRSSSLGWWCWAHNSSSCPSYWCRCWKLLLACWWC